jgi:hypothetical protein
VPADAELGKILTFLTNQRERNDTRLLYQITMMTGGHADSFIIDISLLAGRDSAWPAL